jgi:putative inorganic carbon (HCO3(-)) transporter
MKIFTSSLIFRFLNKLDICENQVVECAKNSIFVKIPNKIADFAQNKFVNITETSIFIKHIDFLIIALLSFSLVSITFASTEIIGLFALAAFLLLLLKTLTVKGEKYDFSSFDIPILLYIAIAGLSAAFSSLLLPSLKGYSKMLIYFAGYLAFFNIFKNNPKRIIYMLSLLALTAAGEALYAVYQQVVGIEALASWQDVTDVNPEQLMNRVYGSLKPLNPNLLAGYLIASFPSSLGMAFWFLIKKKWKFSTVFFAAAALILLATVFTGSRGAYIALAVMMSIFVIISGHLIWNEYDHIKWLKKLWIGGMAAGLLGIIALVMISPSLQHRVLSIFALRGDSSNSYRMNVYTACFKIFQDNWLTGIGPGNTTFRLIYGLYMVTGFDALGAYCVLLEMAVESGIFGVLAFLWIIVLSMIKSIKYIHSNYLIENKIIVSACFMAIMGMMAHGLVDTVWYRPQINVIFWMIIAILAVVTSQNLYVQKENQE